jgi:uncharacterized protein (UPF0218 family)
MTAMARIPEKVRSQLKKPLGKLYKDFKEVRRLSKDHRIISIGDVCTLGLLAMGIRPHLAVYDFRFMRHELDPAMQNILNLYYREPKRYRNPAGTLSDEIMEEAEGLIDAGGAVLIDGEEDLTALAFILKSAGKDAIVYGQPHMGMVVVLPDEKLKKRIEGWLAAAALGHEIQ